MHHTFWTHGVMTIPEFPERVAELRHAGWGTRVRQRADALTGFDNNWFHIPIATPTMIDSDEEVGLLSVRVLAYANKNACIKEIHVRDWREPAVYYKKAVDWRGPEINQVVSISGEWPDVLLAAGAAPHEVDFGIVVCLRVEFQSGDPLGEIVFRGAGAQFDE